jgi:predicted transcriptional regulator
MIAQAGKFPVLDLRENRDALLALSSAVRLDILSLLSEKRLNIDEIAAKLGLPQSPVATNAAILKKRTVTEEGSFIEGKAISATRLSGLRIANRHSARVRLGVKDGANHPGGLNVFGRGFGNYDQAIALRTCF